MKYDIAVERDLLGAMICSEMDLLSAMDLLDGADFMDRRHSVIFNGLIDTYRDHGQVEIGLLSMRLGEVGWSLTDQAYLSQVVSSPIPLRVVSEYARLILDQSLSRRIKVFAHSIDAVVDSQSGTDALRHIEGKLIELAEQIRESPDPSVHAIYAELVADWKRIANSEKVCIPVNSEVVTDAILGWYPGHVVIIGGYTSVGKSTYLAQVVTDACESGASVLVFSLEDSRKEKLLKVLANVVDIPQRALMSGHGDKMKIERGWESIRNFNLLIYDDIYDLAEMRLKVKKAKMHGKVDMVCIDFIQNIHGDGGIYERMSAAAISLQKMARELQVTMIVLSQVSNESMRDGGDIIGLKGAGELAAAADIILWLKRVKGDGNERKLEMEIRKNRPFGETGLRRLRFSERWTRIERGY